MSVRELESLSYLWDGSETGWTLQVTRSRTSRVTFVFSEAGPSSREVIALRQLLPEFRDRPTSEVWARLKRCPTYTCEATLFGLETHQLLRRAVEFGLRTEAVTTHHVHYLPIRDGCALTIEDDHLSKCAAENMIRAGVPLIPVEHD